MRLFVFTLGDKLIAKIPASTTMDAKWEFHCQFPQYRKNNDIEITVKGKLNN